MMTIWHEQIYKSGFSMRSYLLKIELLFDSNPGSNAFLVIMLD